MMAIDELKQDHVTILTGLRVLDAISSRLISGSAEVARHLGPMLEFFQQFADGSHHAKEEETLFPAMVAAGLPPDRGPIEVMLNEHNLGRGFLAVMKENLANVDTAIEARRAVIDAARSYRELLEQHIAKENDVLFMIAETVIAPGEDRQLLEAFARKERERLGPGGRQRFADLLARLSKEFGLEAGPPGRAAVSCSSRV